MAENTTINPNRERLNRLLSLFKEWLHIEDETLLYTLVATKISHHIPGDPIWLMIIGPSSGGKSEYLRAVTQGKEKSIDDLTAHTFVSGYKPPRGDKDEEIPHFAQTLANNIWYIYDLSILMSKNSDERSQILSDMRMIYDGKITKKYGNKVTAYAECPNNTLICGTTPVIDNTILEDQLLGTRFVTYRIIPNNRKAMMDAIDSIQDRMPLMREHLKLAVKEFEELLDYTPPILTQVENQNLQLLSNMTTLLRTAVAFDRQGEPSNIAYPEEPGRLYKQIKKLYTSYLVAGLTQDEAMRCIRKVCVDNINPIRIKLLISMRLLQGPAYGEYVTTTQLHIHTGLGKKTVKSHMHAMNMLGMVSFSVEEDIYGRITKDKWRLLDSNLNLVLDSVDRIKLGRSCYPLFKRKGILSAYV
jgi:hypothetical protein